MVPPNEISDAWAESWAPPRKTRFQSPPNRMVQWGPRFQKLALSTSFQVLLSGVTGHRLLSSSLVRAPVLPLWHRKAQHGYTTMAEAEYAAGPRLISDSNSFTAWSDVPENLCKAILRLLPNTGRTCGHVTAITVQLWMVSGMWAHARCWQ